MSDDQTPAVQRGLLASDDPELWADEFCRIFDGKMVIGAGHEGTVNTSGIIDAGTMIGWFANAMQTALDIKKRRDEIHADAAPLGVVPEAQREAFVEGFEDGREQSDTENDPTTTK